MIRIPAMVLFFLTVVVALGQATSDPRQSLSSDDPALRSEACLALAEKGEEAVPLLVPLLRDPSMLVRHSAAFALSRIGGENVRAVFRGNLDSSDYDLRRTAALGLGMTGKKDMVELLAPLLRDDNWEVRWAAAFALGESRDRRALPLLVPLADSDTYRDSVRQSNPVREAARRAMRRIEGSIGWETDLETALKIDPAGRRPLFLYFRKTGSQTSSRFEESVFGEEMVIDAAQRFRPVWLDHSRSPQVFEEYGIKKVPTIIFLSPQGEQRGRIEGTLGAKILQAEMLKRLEMEKDVHRLDTRRKEDPRDLEAAWQLAEIFMDRSQWQRAIPLLEAIVTADPYNVSSLVDNARFARGYILGRQGDYPAAYQELKKLMEDQPTFGPRAQALYCLGLSALRTGRQEEGINLLRRLSEEYPGSEPAAAAAVILQGFEEKKRPPGDVQPDPAKR